VAFLSFTQNSLYFSNYAVYDVLLPVGQLHTGKDETHGIERDNAPSALAGALPAALDRGLEGQAHGGHQHRLVRLFFQQQPDRRPHIYVGLKLSLFGQTMFELGYDSLLTQFFLKSL